jgi:hypothetical protein
MSLPPMWPTLEDPQCGNPGVDHIGIFLETPNVDPLCGPPNATLGETRPQCAERDDKDGRRNKEGGC